jgi:hypothetical protein
MFNSQKALNHLLKITNHFDPLSSDPVESSDNWWVKEGILISLDSDGYKEKQLLLKEIFQDSFIKENFPEYFIEDRIDGIISNSAKIDEVDRPQFCKDQINDFSNNLKSEIKNWVILLPIDNFEIKKTMEIWRYNLLPQS